MERIIYLIVSVAFVVTVQATVCKNNTECGSGECCYIQPEFMVVSRRDIQPVQLPLQPISHKHDTGVCERYRLQHEHCAPLETANGHCGCGKGMSCQFVPDQPLTAAPSRRSIYMPGPGTFQCEPIH